MFTSEYERSISGIAAFTPGATALGNGLSSCRGEALKKPGVAGGRGGREGSAGSAGTGCPPRPPATASSSGSGTGAPTRGVMPAFSCPIWQLPAFDSSSTWHADAA